MHLVSIYTRIYILYIHIYYVLCISMSRDEKSEYLQYPPRPFGLLAD